MGWQSVKTLIKLLLQDHSDLGLQCLSRLVCPRTWDHYGTIAFGINAYFVCFLVGWYLD